MGLSGQQQQGTQYQAGPAPHIDDCGASGEM